MKKKLFLTGPDRCGKSDMIREELGEAVRYAGGFITVRRRDEQGNVLGFDLTAADGSGGREPFLDLSGKRPVTRLEVFSQMGTRLLDQAEHRSYAVLDELGGVELLDASFVRALVRLLQGDTPCLGVLRAEGGAGKAVGGMGLHLRYELARRVLLDHLKKDPEVLVLETTGKNDPEARKLVAQWVSEYAKTE